MTRIIVRFTCLLIAGVMITSPVSAGIFDWIKLPESLGSMVKAQPSPQALKIDSYEALMGRLYQLNTRQAIESLNSELDNRNINAIQVRISKLPGYCRDCHKDFYVVRDHGIVSEYSNPDLMVELTYSQINRMIPYLEDGNIDFFDWWQLYAIYSIGDR